MFCEENVRLGRSALERRSILILHPHGKLHKMACGRWELNFLVYRGTLNIPSISLYMLKPRSYELNFSAYVNCGHAPRTTKWQ